MLLSKFVVALTALASAGAPDTATPFKSTPDFAPKSVKLDDRHGMGFHWNKKLPCGANRATVTVKFDAAYTSVRTADAPVAKVWLHSETGDASEQWAGAAFKAPTDRWKLNAVSWLEKVTGSKTEGPGYVPADLSRPVQIDLAWTADGVVSVDFGGEFVKKVTLDKPVTEIGVGGSWAKFEFIDLKVGRVGAPDPACERPNVAQIAPPTITR